MFKTVSNVRTSGAILSTAERAGGKLVLLGAVTIGSCALTRMSQRLEVRL